MDGTSGALYAIFFSALASSLREASESLKSDVATAEVWAKALELAKNTFYQYTRGERITLPQSLLRSCLCSPAEY